MKEFNKSEYIDRLYDLAVDDYLTGDIDLMTDSNLFFMIDKFGLEPILDKKVLEIQDRWISYLAYKKHKENIM